MFDAPSDDIRLTREPRDTEPKSAACVGALGSAGGNRSFGATSIVVAAFAVRSHLGAPSMVATSAISSPSAAGLSDISPTNPIRGSGDERC
jgi:hypothetical protein